MKKILPLILLLLTLATGLKAQSLLLYNGDDPIGNGSELYINYGPEHDPVELSLIVLNNSNNGLDVKVRHTDLSLVEGTSANVCWGASCYPPFVYETPEAVRMDAGTTNSTFRGDYTHGGALGTSRVMFSFFDVNNPADSTWIIVNYTIANIAANSFEVTYAGSVITNNQEITIQNEPNHDPSEIAAIVKNINTIGVNAKVRKYDLSLLENTSSNICWGPSCYPPFVFDTPEAVNLASGASDESFRGDYTHGGVQGASKVRFTVYNVDNANDTLSFVVNYIIGYVGVDDFTVSNPEVSAAFPNPATSSISFNYRLPSSSTGAKVKITSLLGTVVDEIILDKTEGKANINVSNLKNGIYFYSLMLNNSAAITRKFVVKR
ncbi:MAG: T9SS type A sorting domain-containing protein [Bacteroidales bacterium]|nr:T9SS type A sorting domain-containing protein [Bacteroidales bacterium]